MKYRKLGTTDIEVSEISFGCWTMGGQNWDRGNPIGWADVDEDEVAEGIKVGLDAGVNHFDNADIYGNGRAERMLARVLERLGVKSDKVIVATKVGHFWGTAEHVYEPYHIRRQCEQSLINLRRDTIDLYYFHHGNFGPDDLYLDDAVAMMNTLVAEGKVRAIGLSAYSTADFTRLAPKVRPAVLQSSANALHTEYIRIGSPVQKMMEEMGLSFVAFSPLGQGLLLDKFSAKTPPQFAEGDHRSKSARFATENLDKLAPKMARIKERFGATTEELARAAQQFVLGHPRVACVIPGFRNARQARCNVAGAGQPLSADDLAFIYKVFGEE